MDSGWKSHRGRHSQNHAPSPGRQSLNTQTDGLNRNEVPQRPPTVGQELPNNLIPSLQDWQLETRLKQPKNRKKGNLEKSKEKIPDVSATSIGAHFGPPPPSASHRKMRDHSKSRMSDAESTSDGDANLQHSLAHGTRPKCDTIHKMESHAGDFNMEREGISGNSNINSIKRLDTNQISGNLVLIREYIKQVNTLMEPLETIGDPADSEKLEKLRKVRFGLLENERTLVELLQRVSILQNEPVRKDGSNSDADSIVSAQGATLANVDGTSGISDGSGDEADDGEDEASDSYEKRNELLRKVAESQLKLKALQGQQALLVALQQQAETRLAQARTFHDHLTSKTNENEQAELTSDEYYASSVLQRDLLNIEQRLSLLQDIHINKEQSASPSRSVDGEARRPEPADRVCDVQRLELQNKLQDLQHKKRQMDDMLKELSTLREVRMQESLQMNGHDANGPGDKKHMVVTKVSVAAAQQSLKSVELNDKMRKLEEMKTWLHNMEDIVYNYHSEQGANENPATAFQPMRGKLSEFPSSETSIAPVGNVQPKAKKGRKTKTDNLSRELSNECIAKLPSHSVIPRVEENRRRESFVEEGDDHDLDIQDKARKIHAAKTKLQKLQNLLNAVQHSQQSGEFMSAELAEQLLSSIDNDEGAAAASNFTNVSSSLEFNDQRLPLHQFDSGTHRVAKVNPKPSIVNRVEQHQQQDKSWAEEMNAAKEDRSRRKSNSTRESIGSVSKLPTSNQELWLEMRHQMALQEELQQRRRELESLMRKDASKNYLLNQDNQSEHLSASAKSEPLLVAASIGATDLTSAATWGGSSIDNGIRENDSQEGQNERINDEEYSSEEAVEQENPAAISLATNESCLSKTKNRATPGSHGEAESSTFGMPDSHRASIGLVSGDAANPPIIHSAPTNNAKVAWQQPERVVAQEHASTHVHDEHLGHDVASLPFSLNLPLHVNAPQQQMETATLLCQTILRDQHVLSGLTQQSPSPGVSGTAVPLSPVNVPDMFQLHHSQMVQQQLLLSLSHCYHLLYLQHLEMQRLRQTIQTAVPNGISYSDPPYPLPQARNLSNTCEASDCQNHPIAPQWHLDNPSMARLSMSSGSSHPIHHSHPPVSNDTPVHGTTTETLNNQVPPGNRANNYWDNFRSYSRQNLLSSTTHPSKSNDCPGGHCQGLPQRITASAPIQNVKQHLHSGYSQFLQLHEEGQQGEGSAGPTDGFSYPRGAENNTRLSHSGSRGLLEVGSVLQNASKDKINKDLGSLASTPNVLKNRGNLSPNSALPMAHSTPSRSLQTGTLSKLPVKTGWNKTNAITRERCTTNDKDAHFNPTQPLEESVYGEVSKLMSQFDSNPQYLIRLLKELRKLNSEKAARNALRALHDASMATPGRNPADPINTVGSAKSSHHASGPSFGTPGGVRPRQPSREDSSSSEENESTSHNVRNKKGGRHYPFLNPRTSYDVVNPSMGTFYDESAAGSNNVALTSYGGVGDSCCINSRHEKSVQCDRRPDDPAGQTMDWSLTNVLSSANRQGNSASEGASSSARESEVSTSDVPCTRFNMLQLEKQMHGIMLSVASFIANFSQNNCSPELMAAISSHILVRVLPTLQNTNQEAWSFIPGQITCVVDSILKKYQGKRIIDCEEALLAELSEVLFNELAFLQLMQNMDGNSAQAQSQKFHNIVQKFTCQPHEYNNGSDTCAGTTGEDTVTEMKLPTNLLSASSSLCVGAHAEATDADLMVMARRGDDEDNDKVDEDFSCDIPDACIGRGVTGGIPSSVACEEPSFRASPLHNNAVHLDSHSLSPLPLPDLGALATAAEGQGEAHYFDREVEMEGEGLGDTQDLAEADQSQGYMEAESALDDVQEGENFQAWGVDHALMNGGVDCTEDDQHNEDDPLGAAGGVSNFVAVELMEAQRAGPELGLDEVPIKLRDGAGSRNATRDRGKEDGNKQEHPEHGDSKGRRSGGTDHGAKLQ